MMMLLVRLLLFKRFQTRQKCPSFLNCCSVTNRTWRSWWGRTGRTGRASCCTSLRYTSTLRPDKKLQITSREATLSELSLISELQEFQRNWILYGFQPRVIDVYQQRWNTQTLLSCLSCRNIFMKLNWALGCCRQKNQLITIVTLHLLSRQTSCCLNSNLHFACSRESETELSYCFLIWWG